MTFCIAVTIGCSIMMTFQADAPDSRGLALTLIFLSLVIVPIHYSTPWLVSKFSLRNKKSLLATLFVLSSVDGSISLRCYDCSDDIRQPDQ